MSSQATGKIQEHGFGPMGDTALDLALFPLRAYHLLECLPLARDLRQAGLSVAIINSDAVRAEREVGAWSQANDVPLWDILPFLSAPRDICAAVFFNDWDAAMRPIVTACKEAGVTTIGWVEGIQDYLDRDTGIDRAAYRRLDHVILPGVFDRRYFADSDQHLHIGQLNRVQDLWDRSAPARAALPNRHGRVLINSNFSYGVLEHCRDAWLMAAVQAVQAAGLEPVISKHPFDHGTLYPELVTGLSFYDALETVNVVIQRFASGILEALAAGVPVIYFPPAEETVDKFADAMGAYSICRTSDALLHLLKGRSYAWDQAAAAGFLQQHAGLVTSEGNQDRRLTPVFKEIIAKSDIRQGGRYAVFRGMSLFQSRPGTNKKRRKPAKIFLSKLLTFFKRFRGD